jgi:hypothetical protein
LIVSQPLAFGTFDRFDNALAVIEFARIPAKSEFVTITVKMFLAHGMKRSQEPAFDQREKRFGAIHTGFGAVSVVAGVFLLE